jgi:hypothetical protein
VDIRIVLRQTVDDKKKIIWIIMVEILEYCIYRVAGQIFGKKIAANGCSSLIAVVNCKQNR